MPIRTPAAAARPSHATPAQKPQHFRAFQRPPESRTKPALPSIRVNTHMEDQPRRRRRPPRNLTEWIEFCWLFASNPIFRAAPDKRKAYFEHRLAKIYMSPCA